VALLSALDAIDLGGSILLQINQRLEREIEEDIAFKQGILNIVEDGVEYAKNLAAVRTGAMRDSITNGGLQYIDGQLMGIIEVGDGAEYWVFVEYGTGQAGAGSEQPEPGVAEGYVHGSSRGMPAQPFMRPTLWYLRQRYGA